MCTRRIISHETMSVKFNVPLPFTPSNLSILAEVTSATLTYVTTTTTQPYRIITSANGWIIQITAKDCNDGELSISGQHIMKSDRLLISLPDVIPVDHWIRHYKKSLMLEMDHSSTTLCQYQLTQQDFLLFQSIRTVTTQQLLKKNRWFGLIPMLYWRRKLFSSIKNHHNNTLGTHFRFGSDTGLNQRNCSERNTGSPISNSRGVRTLIVCHLTGHCYHLSDDTNHAGDSYKTSYQA